MKLKPPFCCVPCSIQHSQAVNVSSTLCADERARCWLEQAIGP